MAHQRAEGRVGHTELGALLRHWRGVRGRSQLDVALDAGISQRHISFVESGRSVPSRQKLIDIAQALDIPFRERNALLLAAGYAPTYAAGEWDAPEMSIISRALARVLRQHEPYPAMVMDRYWNVLMTNRAAPHFFGSFIDMAARPVPRNMLHLIFDPKGMRPFISDWETVAKSLVARVHREAVGHVVDDETKDLLSALMAYPNIEPAWASPAAAAGTNMSPVIPLGFVKDGTILNYFSMVSVLGTPQTILAQELRVECMFPADDRTEAVHDQLMRNMPAAELPTSH